MEIIVVFLVYIGQIMIILGVSGVIPLHIIHLKKASIFSKQFLGAYFICLIIICGSIYYVANHPFVYCPSELKAELTETMKDEAISFNRGFYSSKMPVFPVLISIEQISEDGEVLVETHYWFFGGYTQMVFGGSDAPSIIKELTGL